MNLSTTKKSFVLFLFVLCFSPFAFGTVEHWSLTIMEVSSLCGLLLFLSSRHGKGDRDLFSAPGLLPLSLLWLFCLLQVLPLPVAIVRVLSPETSRVYEGTLGTVLPVHWISLSIVKKETLRELLRLAAYAAFYILTVQLLTRKDLLRKTVTFLAVFATLFAFIAIIQHLTFNGKLLWFRERTTGGIPFGPFVNRNHYAGLMGMVFPVVLGLCLALKPEVGYLSLRERITEFLSRKDANSFILAAFSAIMIGTSVFLSMSRGGIISICIATTLFGTLLLLKKTGGRRGLVVIIVSVLILLCVGWFGWGPIIERFGGIWDEEGKLAETRPLLWQDSLRIIRDFPFTGAGYGVFRHLYPGYQTVHPESFVAHAHNDYLQFLADGGITGMVLTAWFFGAVVFISFRALLRRRERYSVYLTIGSFSGMVAILLHSIFDFNLQIGSNGLYLFFLAGLMVSAAHTRLRDNAGHTLLPKMTGPSLRMMFAPAGLLLLFCLLINLGESAGKMYFPQMIKIDVASLSHEDLLAADSAAHRASLSDPLESRYHCARGKIAAALSRPEEAQAEFMAAVSRNPLNAECLQSFGLFLASAGRPEAAEQFFRSGISAEKKNHLRYRVYAQWLLSRDRKADAQVEIRSAILLAPAATVDYVTLQVLNGMNDGDIHLSLPQRVLPHLHFADYLAGTGKGSAAAEEYVEAFDYLGADPAVNPSYFERAFRYLVRTGMLPQALDVARKGASEFPENPDLLFAAAEAYSMNGLASLAVEHYRKVLLIAPKDERAAKKLRDLGAAPR